MFLELADRVVVKYYPDLEGGIKRDIEIEDVLSVL